MPQSKVVGEPSETIQVKERGKIYVGQLVGVGSREEIQQRLNSILEESSQSTVTPSKPAQSKTSQEKGTSYCKYCVIQAVMSMHTCTCTCTCMNAVRA